MPHLLNRRHVLRGSALLPLAISACAGSPAREHDARKYVINANMVIPQNSDEQFDEKTKAQLRATGLTAIKQSVGGSQGTYEQTIEMLDWIDTIYAANPDVFVQINSIADLKDAHETGRIGVIYSFEAATMFDDKVERIAEFASRGVRIMQPGYNNTNAFGAGVMSTDSPLGLSDLGREAIAAMEASNVLVDLSHAHEETAKDVLSMASKPPAMTHAGCDGITPHQRNKSDGILKTLADKGGVVGIYEMSYLTPDLEQQSLDAFMAHITHAVNVCGEDHVGIGSDTMLLGFDTGPESMAQWNAINKHRQETGVAAPGEGPPPYVEGINGPHKMTTIAAELAARGFKAAVIDKIMGQNFARVFAETWPA